MINAREFDALTADVAALVLARADHDGDRCRALLDTLTTEERKLLPEVLWQLCCALVTTGDEDPAPRPRAVLHALIKAQGGDVPVIQLKPAEDDE